MKPPISFGLPGRLSIFGFDQEEAESGIRRLSGWFLLASTLLLLTVTGVLLWIPDWAAAIQAWPVWIWPAAGIILGFLAWMRSRLAFVLLLAAWIAFTVYFVPNQSPAQNAQAHPQQTINSPGSERP